MKQYDTILLKDGRKACVVEVLSEDTFIVDVGSSEKDWDTITIKKDDIVE
jgi:hypothetical protein